MIVYAWREPIDSTAVEALHAEAFGHDPVEHDWSAQLEQHSLGWVTARIDERLVGFVNVAWDGFEHAFLIDTIVAADARRQGIGEGLVRAAIVAAKGAGCAWLHVDFDDDLIPFYIDGLGFESTPAGLVDLT